MLLPAYRPGLPFLTRTTTNLYLLKRDQPQPPCTVLCGGVPSLLGSSKAKRATCHRADFIMAKAQMEQVSPISKLEIARGALLQKRWLMIGENVRGRERNGWKTWVQGPFLAWALGILPIICTATFSALQTGEVAQLWCPFYSLMVYSLQ